MIPELIDIHNTIDHLVMSDGCDGYDDEQLARMGIDVDIIEIKTPLKKTVNWSVDVAGLKEYIDQQIIDNMMIEINND